MNISSLTTTQSIPEQIMENMQPNSHGYVWLNDNKWDHLSISMHISKVKEWTIEQCLSVEDNGSSKILIQIKDISFPWLKSLQLYKNTLQSIQQLCRVYMPCISSIYLCKILIMPATNNITQIRSIRKCNWKKLTKISLHCNFINEFESLSELYAPQLDCIFVELYESQPSYCSDLNWIFKLNSTQLSWLRTFLTDCSHQQLSKNKKTQILEKDEKQIQTFVTDHLMNLDYCQQRKIQKQQ